MHTIRWFLLGTFLLAACGGADESAIAPNVVDTPAPGDEVPAEQGELTEQGEPSEEAEPPEGGELVVGDDPCTTDADCVPADCCHAAACVAQTNAPDCGGAMCTMECRYGTIDCGGGCLCHEGRCAARLSEPPVVPE